MNRPYGSVRIIQVPALSDNYFYFIACEKTGQAAVVDSPDAPLTRSTAKREGLNLTAIFNTHHHWDHVGANEDLLSKQDLDVYGFGADRDRIPGLTHPVAEGDTVQIGSLAFKVIEIPGHTSGHIAYYGNGVLFCGDTLFVSGCGRLFEGTPAQMHASLTKIAALPDDTRAYCAHEYSQKNLDFALTLEPGNDALLKKAAEVARLREKNLPTVPTTIGEEKGYNPFLRTSSPEIIESLRKRKLVTCDDPVEVFAAIRGLRNTF